MGRIFECGRHFKDDKLESMCRQILWDSEQLKTKFCLVQSRYRTEERISKLHTLEECGQKVLASSNKGSKLRCSKRPGSKCRDHLTERLKTMVCKRKVLHRRFMHLSSMIVMKQTKVKTKIFFRLDHDHKANTVKMENVHHKEKARKAPVRQVKQISLRF